HMLGYFVVNADNFVFVEVRLPSEIPEFAYSMLLKGKLSVIELSLLQELNFSESVTHMNALDDDRVQYLFRNHPRVQAV
ncbi:hypothetical protein ACJX0J_026371, partial [Zea mays]